MAAVGDPHISSLWGCEFDADKSVTEAVLMKCADQELKIRYSQAWSYHIFEVVIIRDGQEDVYHRDYLKHAQHKVVCGNSIEFHRYIAGINLRVTTLQNHHIDGLFNDSRCIKSWHKRHVG